MDPTSNFAHLTPERVARMRRTADDLAALIGTAVSIAADQQVAPGAWSATDIVCHLRDVEEAYLDRIRLILANDEPALIQFDPERWVDERQYRCSDAGRALSAFRARRADTLRFLESLDVKQWERGGRHPSRGRLTVRKIIHSLAKHDDEHVEQIARELARQP